MHESKRDMLIWLPALLLSLAGCVRPKTTQTRIKTMSQITNFDFLAGQWEIANRRLATIGGDDWQEFKGSATVWSVLGGNASIEELRGVNQKLLGMGVRVLHTETGLWADHWTSAGNGMVNAPMMGNFKDNIAKFESDDIDGAGNPIKAHGIWDRITPTSCRWHQATGNDGGATWQPNWFMDWTRFA
jgi:hypothetical protein